MLEQGKVRRNSGESCSKMAKDQSNHMRELVPSEVSLIYRQKRMIYGIGNALFSNFSHNFKLGKILW